MNLKNFAHEQSSVYTSVTADILEWKLEEVKKCEIDVLDALIDMVNLVQIKYPDLIEANWIKKEELNKVRDLFLDKSHEEKNEDLVQEWYRLEEENEDEN